MHDNETSKIKTQSNKVALLEKALKFYEKNISNDMYLEGHKIHFAKLML